MEKALEQLRADELTDDLRMVASALGMEVVKGLLREFGGVSIYFPRISRFDKFIERYLRENKNLPVSKIATELNVSAQYLRRLKRDRRIN
jgi:AraC-like DNA-binding protein